MAISNRERVGKALDLLCAGMRPPWSGRGLRKKMGEAMSKIAVSYNDLQDVDPGYVQRLKEKEEAVRRAMAKIARYTSVPWTNAVDSAGHTLFRLLTYDRSDCIAQFSPLDLTLDPDAFEKLIVEGRRPCP